MSRTLKSHSKVMGSDSRGKREATVPHAFTLAAQFHQAGRIADAVAQYKRAIAVNPRDADSHNNLGVALAQLGAIDEARRQFERALHLNPDHAYARNNLGSLLAKGGRTDDAVPHFQSACALDPALFGAHKSLAATFASLGRFDDAARHYRRVLTGNPNDAETHNELATIFKFQGRFEDAVVHYGRAIAIRPVYPQAHYNRAELKTFYPDDADLIELRLLAENRSLTPKEAVYVHFALAKAYDDCGEFARAFDHLREGNNLKRRQIDYDETAVFRYLRRTAAIFDRSLINRFEGAGDPSAAPIFVVGMPRSGSTLVEQILSSHPEVHGAGELTDLEAAIQTVLRATCQPLSYPECVPFLDGPTLRQIGTAYLARLKARVTDGVRIVDKLPANFIHLGLIHLILPNAKIIYTTRDPIDTCFSCYSKLFTAGQSFTYDLTELGRFFRLSTELMAHWRSVLPPAAILDVSYEDVVDDLEGQARRLLDHCGLPWDDRCLGFHSNGRPVCTASVLQVRQPLFRSSLQRWRRYESGLEPLLRELGHRSPGDSAKAKGHAGGL